MKKKKKKEYSLLLLLLRLVFYLMNILMNCYYSRKFSNWILN